MTWRRRAAIVAVASLVVLALATLVFLVLGWGGCQKVTSGSEGARACDSLRRTNDLGGSAETASLVVVGLGFGALGGLLALRHSKHPIGWIFLGTALIMLLNGFTTRYAIYAVNEAPGTLPFGVLASWLNKLFGGTIFFAGFVFAFLLFPTGHLLSARWRPVAWLAVIGFAITTGVPLFMPTLRLTPFEPNPMGSALAERYAAVVEIPALIALAIVVAAVVLGLIIRFRRSAGLERQQMRLVALSGTAALVAIALGPVFWAVPALEPLWGPLWALTATGIPVAATIAILRYRLYDIDVLINRALIYGSLTLLLGLVYLALVVALQAVLAPFTAESDLAVAGSTLAVAALVRPARSRVQAFIDRRFYRRKYDAARTLKGFTRRLRDEVELDVMRDDLVALAGQTMQPTEVSLWLRGYGSARGARE